MRQGSVSASVRPGVSAPGSPQCSPWPHLTGRWWVDMPRRATCRLSLDPNVMNPQPYFALSPVTDLSRAVKKSATDLHLKQWLAFKPPIRVGYMFLFF